MIKYPGQEVRVHFPPLSLLLIQRWLFFCVLLAFCCGETHVFEVIDYLRMFCDFEENFLKFLCLLLEGKEWLSCLHGLEASWCVVFFFSTLTIIKKAYFSYQALDDALFCQESLTYHVPAALFSSEKLWPFFRVADSSQVPFLLCSQCWISPYSTLQQT